MKVVLLFSLGVFIAVIRVLFFIREDIFMEHWPEILSSINELTLDKLIFIVVMTRLYITFRRQ